MATTTVSDAVVVPQAKGTGLGSEDDNVDAASAALLSAYSGGEYVRSGMGFTRDDANNEIDVGSGFCYIIDDSSSTSNSRGTGGNAQIQSTSSSGYDTEIPDNQVYLVIFPTSASVSVSDGTASDIWVNITDVTSNNAVELRSSSGGGTTAEPSNTYLKLGNIADNGSGQATRSNDRKGDPGKILLQTNTPSGVSETTFTSGINESFDRYVFELLDVVPASDDVNFDMQVSTDGGATWEAGSQYDLAITATNDAGSDVSFGSANNDQFRMTSGGSLGVGSAAGEGLMGTVQISKPANGSLQQLIKADLSLIDSSDNAIELSATCKYEVAEAINGVRFAFDSGNIESGTVSMYGVLT